MIGSISHGTLRPEDLFESFLGCATTLAKKREPDDPTFLERVRDIESYEYDGDDLSEVVECLSDILNEMSPLYTYFGAHEGDGSDFGFWPSDSIDELAKYDSFPDTLPGEDFAVVSDHGNISVYGADGVLLWDCV